MDIAIEWRRLSAVLFVLAAGALLLPTSSAAQSLDSRLDAQQARTDAAANTGRGSLVSRNAFGDTLLGQYPYLDATTDGNNPTFTFNFFVPVFYNSNAEALPTGGSQTVETTPEIRLAWSKQLNELHIKLSMLFDANSDRYSNSNGANADTAYTRFRAQYVTGNDDQEFEPFVQYTPTTVFAPFFSSSTVTNNDFTVGFDKAFNFDSKFRRIGSPEAPIGASGDTSKATVWSFAFTGTVTRRETDVGPSSYSVTASPSLTYNLSNYPNANSADAQWNISFEVDVTRRWYDSVAGFAQRDWQINPILTVEFMPPLSWFRGENKLQQDNNSKALGRPKVDFQLAFTQVDSNNPTIPYHQWAIGPMIKTGWNF